MVVTETLDALWRKGDGSNLVGLASGLLASAVFNDSSAPIRIAGVREINRDLFRLLDGAASVLEAGEVFTQYMIAMFGLLAKGERPKDDGAGRRRYRANYLRLLRGWAYDANSPEGAVLKGWVESRFGLLPTYHKEPLIRFQSRAWMRYVEEKMGSRFHNNAIFSQLDLLYEFAQWVLDRFFGSAGRHMTLYRGVNDFNEHPIIRRIDTRRCVVRLNNLVSFTCERDMAGWFGDRILEARVPYSKILFFNTLLSHHPLKGEGEVLVIGGDYLVKATYD
jgi:NAD+--dinitrogen-reductase ADP-D-ribosyltransferase